MTPTAPGTVSAPVPRVVITGEQPQHLSYAEAHAWIREELAGLRSLPGVTSVVLAGSSRSRVTPVRGPGCASCTSPTARTGTCAAHPVCAERIMDLRLLGMRPALLFVGEPAWRGERTMAFAIASSSSRSG